MSTTETLREPEADERPVDRTWREAARRDFEACTEASLHLVVGAIFVLALGGIGVTTVVLSDAFFTSGDLPGTIELLTSNAAWLFTSLVAVVGLFVGYPRSIGDRAERDGADSTVPARTEYVGRLASRTILVAGAVVAGLVVLGAVGLVAYESFSPLAYVGFAAATVALAAAYASVGVSVSAVANTPNRALAWLFGLFFFLAFCWDTWIVPLGIALLTAGGDPAVLGNRPGWFEALVATSPGGAYGALGDVLAGASSSAATLVALVGLVAWIVVPAVIAVAVVDRR